jgi:Heparinase II/III-like protein
MRRWLGSVLSPAGAVPLLNDGYPVPAGLLGALRPEPPAAGPLLTLPDTGLVQAAVGGWHLLADVGAACPDQLPAHAHADTLGCVVHVDGTPLLIDTGTSTYAAGPARDYERSTAAHNTVGVDGADSTEVWGAFRAGRRARVRGFAASSSAAGVNIEAWHDGFRRLPGRPRHQRHWFLTAAGLRVNDLVSGQGRHQIVIYWHLAAGSTVLLEERAAVIRTPAGSFRARVSTSDPATLAVGSKPVAVGFEQRTDALLLTCGIEAQLPVRVSTAWRRASRSGAAGHAGELA